MNDEETAQEESDSGVLPGQEDIFGLLRDDVVTDESIEEDVITEEETSTVAAKEDDEPGFLQTTDGQLSFVDSDEWWKEHWVGMPEFIQNDLEPWKSIYVHFGCYEDMKRFSEMVSQLLTADTRSIWFPKAEIGRMSDKVFINEE